MNNAINLPKNLIIFGVPALMIGAMVLLAQSSTFTMNPNYLSIGITFDLLLTVPFVYFLLVRKTEIPKTTIVPFIVIGMIVCSFILPSENQYYLSLFKSWVFPVIELCVVSYVVYNVHKMIKHYKSIDDTTIDFFSALKKTCYENFPKRVVMPLVTEIAVFYYGFITWRNKPLKENEFTYHKNNGVVPVLIVLLFMVVVETVVFHLLLIRWNDTAAWILTLLSVYSGFQLFGFLKSITKRPIRIEKDKLLLHYGIMSETTIELSQISHIEVSSKDIEFDDEVRKLSPLGELDNHNIVLHLKEEHILIGLYGIKKSYKTLALHIDDEYKFKDLVGVAMNQK